MSFHTNIQSNYQPHSYIYSSDFKPDRMAVISTLHRIASVAIERILLMMNNTEMCRIRRLRSIQEVLLFLNGNHADAGLPGDRGDFYRRKLADQMHVTFAIEGVTHNNVMAVVETAIVLENETRKVLEKNAKDRHVAPNVEIDETILNILSRISDIF